MPDQAAAENYNVAFRYTAAAGGYHGVVTWSTYPSKEYFDEKVRPRLSEMHEEILEEGISSERAVELVRQTPFAARVRVALQEATLPGSDEVDDEILRMHLAQAILADTLA